MSIIIIIIIIIIIVIIIIISSSSSSSSSSSIETYLAARGSTTKVKSGSKISFFPHFFHCLFM